MPNPANEASQDAKKAGLSYCRVRGWY